MKKRVYSQIKEILYTETLSNGLKVTLLPRPDYHKTYGLFTTNYGSIDNEFVPYGKSDFVKVPDGIAHFLEHKMFEKEEGDVFQTFSKQGAAANAFTSFTRTSYLFSSTDYVEENVQTLLNFVQSPYFTKETVEKEKGIIGQEIQMYQDDPSWRLFFGLLGNMYPNHPLHVDIAGTIESIAEITAEDLYTCYRTFYHPSNMNLLVVGNLDPERMMETIRQNQASKNFVNENPIQRRLPSSLANDVVKERTLKMSITRPKVILGVKGMDHLPQEGRSLLKYRLTLNLFFELLVGSTSQNYLRMYNSGLLDASFDHEFSLDRGFHYADFGGDTSHPEKLAEEIIRILLKAEHSEELTECNLNRLKRKMIGKYLQSLNSLEYIANQFSQMQYGETTLFDMAEIIENIQLSDVLSIGTTFINSQGISKFFMAPK